LLRPLSVPILPGDASLAENFIADIKVQAHREEINIISEDLALIPVGSILFHLVILRIHQKSFTPPMFLTAHDLCGEA
jgi:hypothetical protein